MASKIHQIPNEHNSSQDFEELNEDITYLISMMSNFKESTKDYEIRQTNEIDKNDFQSKQLQKLLDSQILSMSPIWKNTPQTKSQSPQTNTTCQNSFNESFFSNQSMSRDLSPSHPYQMHTPIKKSQPKYNHSVYSMRASISSKYESVFNSNQEDVYVPHLDNEKNMINLLNIFTGKEHRTTLMIRHIPNKYTLKLFTDEINQKFNNKYDVFYLPIDYANNCNLGFAFINFVNPMHIIDFYESFRGKKWGRYLSDKRCELAFAKIQGKQNLIVHFEKGQVLHNQSLDKKPIILCTPSPLPFISLSLKYEEVLREYYPFISYTIDMRLGCLIVSNFFPHLMI